MRLFAAFATSLVLFTSLPAAAATPAKPAAKPAPAPAAAAPAAAPASGGGFQVKDIQVAGFIGGEFGDMDGITLRADASMPIMPLADKIKLLGVASLGYTHLGMDIPYGSVSWNMIKLLAAGRVQMAVTPEIDVYGDAGLGFYFGSGSFETTIPGFPSSSTSEGGGGFAMKFAVGGWYRINPKIQVGAEAGLHPYFGDADTTNFVIGVGAQYSL